MIIAKLGTLLLGSLNKWIVIGVAAIAILAGAYWKGYRDASGSCEAEKRRALEALIEYQQEIQKENDIINEEIIEDLNNQKQKTRIIYKKVIEYVENNPDSTNCKLDADGLRLWNGDTD